MTTTHRRPTKADILDIETIYDSAIVRIERGAMMYQGSRYEHAAYVVTVKPHEHRYRRDSSGRLEQITKTVKRFYGETAWMDAQRFAQDYDFGATV